MKQNSHTPSLPNAAWFDKALEGQPDATKARVMEIVLKYGIDIDDPFFILLVALGRLQVLIEDSPTEWRDLFNDFQRELQQWTQTNLKTLELLAHKAETTDRLAETSATLTATLSDLTRACGTLMPSLATSSQSWTNLEPRLQSFENSLMTSLKAWETENQQTIGHLQSSLSKQNKDSWSQSQIWGWNNQRLCLMALSLSIITYGSLFMLQMDQSRLIQKTHQRTEWLLKKANRDDCLNGLKPFDAPECKGL